MKGISKEYGATPSQKFFEVTDTCTQEIYIFTGKNANIS